MKIWKVRDDRMDSRKVILLQQNEVDWDSIERYMKHQPEMEAKVRQGMFEFTESNGSIWRVPAPDPAAALSVPVTINGVQDVQLPEEIIHLLRTYIHGGVASGILNPTPNEFGQLLGRNGRPAFERLVEWYERMRVAASWLGDKRAANGVRLINICLNQLQEIILDQDFALVFALLHITFILPFRNREAGIIIVRFIGQLLHVLLGPLHPLSRIWARLSRLSTSELLYALTTAMRMSLESLTKYIETPVRLSTSMVEQLMMLPGDKLPTLSDSSMRAPQPRSRPTFFNIQFTIVVNVCSWYLQARNAAAIMKLLDRMAARMAADADEDPRSYGPMKFMYGANMSSMYRMQGQIEKERELIQETYEFYLKHYGPQNSWTITCMHRMVNWCNNFGNPEEAELWSRRIDEACSGWLQQTPELPSGVE